MKPKLITEDEKALLHKAFWSYIIIFDVMAFVLGTAWKVWCAVCGF